METYSINSIKSQQQQAQINGEDFFSEHLKKCRCCFKELTVAKMITVVHTLAFHVLTGVEMKCNTDLAAFLCLDCATILENFGEFGKAAEALQSQYYEHVNCLTHTSVENEKVEDIEKIVGGLDRKVDLLLEIVDEKIDDDESETIPQIPENSSNLTKISPASPEQDSRKTKISLHENPRSSYECPIKGCNKILKNKQAFYYHRDSVHQAYSKDETTCLICGKAFNSKNRLKNHQRSHNIVHNIMKKFNFKCNRCDAAFPKQSILREHIAVKHEGIRYHWISRTLNSVISKNRSTGSSSSRPSFQ